MSSLDNRLEDTTRGGLLALQLFGADAHHAVADWRQDAGAFGGQKHDAAIAIDRAEKT